MRDDEPLSPTDPGTLLPRLSPLGVLESADNDAASPRLYSRRLRVAALLLIGVFAVVVVATTALSLGAYCLTTDAGGSVAARAPKR